MQRFRNASKALLLFYCLLSPLFVRGDNSVLSKPNLKVLDIGNSYTDDATAYLPEIVAKLGVDVSDMCLYKAIRGGASFWNWYNIYSDSDPYNYHISKVLGGLKANVSEGSCEPYDGSLFREALTGEQWDVIIIHQYSAYATSYDQWFGNGRDGYLTELLELLKRHQPQCQIGFLLIHSYAGDYVGNVEHSAFDRWVNIAAAAKRLVDDYDIELIIPYGTAVQNLRTTEYNNQYDLTRDLTHLGSGLARYTAACCYYESLIAPRTGVSMLGANIPYLLDNIPETSQISVTEENMLTAQKAAKLAVMYPFKCYWPNNYSAEKITMSVSNIYTSSTPHSGTYKSFSIDGKCLDRCQKGVNIIRSNDRYVKSVK